MPFTVSHAAVAAPLARRGLIFSALVVGSIAPDSAWKVHMTPPLSLAVVALPWLCPATRACGGPSRAQAGAKK